MSPQAQLVMVAWMPLVLYLFMRFPAQKAVVIGFIAAWLFLPQRAGFALPGVPDYDRMSATGYGILLATAIYDVQRFRSFKLAWLDLPMLVWCLCPLFSSISNGLGAYDGASGVLTQTVSYGVPYFLGRIYLNNLNGLRLLALGIFIGGIVYVPFCLYESRMSPQLHKMVYGYQGIIDFGQGMRLGGFRPTVFMQHGLSVGMWMMAAALACLWLWQSRTLKQFWGIPMSVWTGILLVTVILVKSTGAYIYLVYGIITLFVAKWLRTTLPLMLLVVTLGSYLYMGMTGTFTGEQSDRIIAAAEQVSGPERAQSLQFRLDNEEILGEKARQQFWFGWGGYGRNRVYDYNWAGELVDITVTDSLWIIAFGINGALGLASVFGASLVPALSFLWSPYGAHLWFHPKVGPAALIATIVVLYMLDCSLNNQPNPVFTLASGGIAGLLIGGAESKKRLPSRRKAVGRLPANSLVENRDRSTVLLGRELE
jgi:hypothetical protein